MLLILSTSRPSKHFYRNCKFFNKKYSLEQNQRYYKKKHKGDSTTEDTKAPEGGRGSVGESRFSSSSFSDVISYPSYTEYYARDRYGIFI